MLNPQRYLTLSVVSMYVSESRPRIVSSHSPDINRKVFNQLKVNFLLFQHSCPLLEKIRIAGNKSNRHEKIAGFFDRWTAKKIRVTLRECLFRTMRYQKFIHFLPTERPDFKRSSCNGKRNKSQVPIGLFSSFTITELNKKDGIN